VARSTHVPFRQQPFGHELARQTHWPFMQREPTAHMGPVPHAQAPTEEQLSARFGSHPAQIALPTPQVLTDGGLQVLPEQQPVWQVETLQPLQRPSMQDSPAGHTSQLPPPPPHESGVSPARQRPPEQQPSEHDVPSHMQVPPMQRWPFRHEASLPQRQVPVAEQLSARMSHATQVEPASPHVERDRVLQVLPSQQPLEHELPLHTHWPPSQTCPAAQAAVPPHAHAPVASHRSALAGSQAAQRAAFNPHAFSDGATHTLLWQQPSAQFFSSHTQTPFAQI